MTLEELKQKKVNITYSSEFKIEEDLDSDFLKEYYEEIYPTCKDDAEFYKLLMEEFYSDTLIDCLDLSEFKVIIK